MLKRFVAGQPLFDPSVRQNKHGLPTVLPFMRQILNLHPKYLRLVNTILSISRMIDWWPNCANYDPIITNYSGEDHSKLSRSLGKLAINLCPSLRNLDVDWSKFHRSDSAGILAKAVPSSVTEFIHLPKDLIEDIKIFGGEGIKTKLEQLSEIPENVISLWSSQLKVKDGSGKSMRRISYVRDPDGKVRIICIFDYWSQTVLKPLHDKLFRVLASFPTDCTFDQSKFLGGAMGDTHYCFDLSSATDRFPLTLQVDVLSAIVGKEKAEAWGRIMSKYDVDTPEGNIVKYNCGQPMGAYSSWAVFTLCHHLVVQLAARKALNNRGFWTGYALLGDDIVIHNHLVSEEYLKIMASLGVEINLTKSVISKRSMEFAKRDFINSEEWSPISLRSIIDSSQFWPELAAVLINLRPKGLDNLINPGVVKALYRALGRSPSWSTRLSNKILALHALQNIEKGRNQYYWASYFMIEIAKIDLGSCRWHHNLELLLEVWAAHHLLSIQNATLATQKELFKIKTTITECFGYTPDPSIFPPVAILVDKTNELMTEGTTISSIVQSKDYLQIIHCKLNYLPDPRSVLSGDMDRSRKINPIMNKLISYIKENKFQLMRDIPYSDIDQ